MAIQTVFLAENTTAYATDVMNLVDPLYTDLDGSNVSDKTGTGTTLVLSASPTFTGSVSLNSGADFKIYSDAGSTLKFFVDGATGSFGIPSGQKFYLDGTALSGDSYIYEPSANILTIVAGGVGALEVRSTYVHVNGVDAVVDATKKFYLDGGTNTSFRESSSDVITAEAGGVDSFSITATGIGVASGNKIFVDGVSQAGDSWIDEVSANAMRFVSGNNEFMRSNASGEILLANVDPPTANYANRNSTLQGKANVTIIGTGGGYTVTSGAYNVSSFFLGGGSFTVNWDTNFSTTDYACVFSCGNFNNTPPLTDYVLIKTTSSVELDSYSGGSVYSSTLSDAVRYNFHASGAQ